MANQIRLKRASGSDPGASDLVTGEVAIRTDTGKIFTKKDDNSVVEVGVGISDVVDDTSPQLGGDLQSNGNDIDFADNDKAVFGTGSDLQIYHDGSNSYISEGGTGDLIITGGVIRPRTDQFTLNNAANTENMISAVADGAVKLFFNGSKKFETTSSGISVTGGATFSGDVSFGDNNITNVGVIALDTIKGDADDNTNIMFGGSDTVTINPAGTTRLAINTSGISVTGNITVSGTVDGRDVAADGTKLDGIESGATADQSASEILTLIKTVDGAGSGLDADTLDGATSSFFQNADNLSSGTVPQARLSASSIVALIADQTIAPSTIDMEDSEKILLGTSDDLQIFHDGSNSHIHDNGTGQLRIRSNQFRVNDPGDSENMIKADINGAVSLFFDDSQKFFTSSTGVSLANGDLDVNGNNIKFGHCSSSGSDDTLMFGPNGDDLKIFHSTNGVFSVNTGNAYLRNTGDFSSTRKVYIMAKNDEESVTCNSDGSVEIYYDNSKKFETLSTGVLITGSDNGDGGAKGDFKFFQTDGTQKIMFDASAGNLEFQDNSKATFGGGDDLQIYHSSGENFIRGNGTVSTINIDSCHELKLRHLDTSGSNIENMIVCNDDSSVELYHNGSKKLETSVAGLSITGDILPEANNSRDLGSSSLRWQNLFVNDMHFANSPDNPNKVDGTWGDWTLQEGEATIYMLNNRNGKKYKMNLTEV